jgi:hypothetical protein
VGASCTTPGGASHADSRTAAESADDDGGSGSELMIRLGEALKRKRDHELYQRTLAQCKSASIDGGGPKPSHFFIVLSSDEITASSITHPRTERW